ncbi:hypothetical protein [Nonomuraea aridisoli]|nr:hypothetical protein [Nonomuraea aridisoli]
MNDTKQSAEGLAILEQHSLYTDVGRKREGTWVYVSACAIAPSA